MLYSQSSLLFISKMLKRDIYKNQRSYPILQQRNAKLMSIWTPSLPPHYSNNLYAFVNHIKMSACYCGSVCGWWLVEATSPGPSLIWLWGRLGEAAHLLCIERSMCPGVTSRHHTQHTQGEISCMATWSTRPCIIISKQLSLQWTEFNTITLRPLSGGAQ
jgi:hypothetical protein